MPASLRVGRYAIYGAIAGGGMATVHLGRTTGDGGFRRTVAVKRLHPHLAADPELVDSLLDEAHLVARIRHLNVVATYDVVRAGDEVLLVMEYVPGESLARLLASAKAEGRAVPRGVIASVLCGTLHGLHASHEARSESGEPLHIVHRDVSPQNIIVSTDGVARVLDFGVAKAVGRLRSTQDGRIKGKLAYMAPEQLRAGRVDRRTDVFAAGIVLWEALTGERLFAAETEALTMTNVLERPVPRPRELAPDLEPGIEAVVMRALARDPAKRFSTARQMALELEAAVKPASPAQVETWVIDLAGDALEKRAREVAAIEKEVGETEEAAEGAPATAAADPPPSLRARVDTSSTTIVSAPARKTSGVFIALMLAAVVTFAALLLWRGRQARAIDESPPAASQAFVAGTAPPSAEVSALAAPPRPPAAPTSTAGAKATSELKPHRAPIAVPRARGAPSPATAPKSAPGVTEYLGEDGVMHFCRPPNCPN